MRPITDKPNTAITDLAAFDYPCSPLRKITISGVRRKEDISPEKSWTRDTSWIATLPMLMMQPTNSFPFTFLCSQSAKFSQLWCSKREAHLWFKALNGACGVHSFLAPARASVSSREFPSFHAVPLKMETVPLINASRTGQFQRSSHNFFSTGHSFRPSGVRIVSKGAIIERNISSFKTTIIVRCRYLAAKFSSRLLYIWGKGHHWNPRIVWEYGAIR